MRRSTLKRFGKIPTATGGISRLAYARALEAGLKLQPLLRRADLSKSLLENRRARINVHNQIKFLELVSHALNDDLLGFHLAQNFEFRQIGLLYYVLASSETLDDALRKAERYSRIVNEGISVRYRSGGSVAITVRYVGVQRHSEQHQIEFWLTCLVRLCRHLTNRRLLASRIKMIHRRKSGMAKMRAYFGCDISFGSDVDEIVFPARTSQMKITTADPYLNELLTGYCEDALAHRQVNRGSLRPDVENAIVPLLPHGKARVKAIATALGLGARTLARRLSAEGLTFAEVLDKLRADLAMRYLQDNDLTISEIAWLLGYREASVFTHAFKRWTGMTPKKARDFRGTMRR